MVLIAPVFRRYEIDLGGGNHVLKDGEIVESGLAATFWDRGGYYGKNVSRRVCRPKRHSVSPVTMSLKNSSQTLFSLFRLPLDFGICVATNGS